MWKAPNATPPPYRATLGRYGGWRNLSGAGTSATLPGNNREGRMADTSRDTVVRGVAKGGDYANGLVDFSVERDADFSQLIVKANGKPITSFRVGTDEVISVDVREQENVVIGGDISTTPEKSRQFESAWLEDVGTNWRKDGTDMIFTNPKTLASLAIPVSEPGPFTPTDTYPVYGQPGMLFSLVMGIAHKDHTILSGPTGTGKTTAYQFVAELLGWNFFRIQIDPKTEGASLIGEYLPAGTGKFEWTDGTLTEAVRASRLHPTIVIFDELSRIGNVAELARIYSLLDDGRFIALPERRHELGKTEIIEAGELYIGATMNPADDDGADYIGVRELDPALMSRFSYSPLIKYPTPEVEVKTLLGRVEALSLAHAERMVDIGNAIREAEEVHYPFSFRELMAWAKAIPYYGFIDAAKIAFIYKATPIYRPALLSRVEMTGAGS